MKVIVIDGQGGRMGRMIVERIKSSELACKITAIGTNSIATAAMVKAGADEAATGENSVIVAVRDADVIIGPIGIIAADSLIGEITDKMAVAIGRSRAKKLLIPVNSCNNIVIGTKELSMATLITGAVEALQELINNRHEAG